jgi:hypothetical protein
LDDVAAALLAHDRQRRLGHPEGAEELRLDLVALTSSTVTNSP